MLGLDAKGTCMRAMLCGDKAGQVSGMQVVMGLTRQWGQLLLVGAAALVLGCGMRGMPCMEGPKCMAACLGC